MTDTNKGSVMSSGILTNDDNSVSAPNKQNNHVPLTQSSHPFSAQSFEDFISGHNQGRHNARPESTHPSPQNTNMSIMDQITMQSIANNFNIVNSTLGTINTMHQITTQQQNDMINILQKRVNSLTDQNEGLNTTIQNMRSDHDALKRSTDTGFDNVKKEISKISCDIKSTQSQNKHDSDDDSPIKWLRMRPQKKSSESSDIVTQQKTRQSTQDSDNIRSDNIRSDNIRSDNIRSDNIRSDNIRTTFTITPIFPGMIPQGIGNGMMIPKSLTNGLTDSLDNNTSGQRRKNGKKTESESKNKKRQEQNTDKKNKDDKTNKRPRMIRMSEKDMENGPQNLMSMMIFSEIMNQMTGQGGKPTHDNDDPDVFKEIKMPDMEKEIRKNINMNELENFEPMNLKNLDDIAIQGQKFIDMIDEHNKKVNNKIKNKTKKSKKSKTNDDLNTLQDFLTEIVNASISSNNKGMNASKKSSKNVDLKDSNTSDDDDTGDDSESTDTQTIEEDNTMNLNDEIEKDADELYNFFGKRYSINPRKLMRLVKPIKVLNTMIGMKDVKGSIFQFVSTFLQGERKDGMLNTAIYGKPGVGKTDLGKILCMIYAALEIVPSAKFKLVRASDLIGQYVGHTRQKTKKVIDEADGGVLFIDEAYALTSGSGDKHSYGKECIDTLNQELSENRRKLVVIIAGYETEIKEGFFKINQGLERRFPFRYILKDYKKEELKDIFLRMLRLDGDMYLFKADEKPDPCEKKENHEDVKIKPESVEQTKKIMKEKKSETVTDDDIMALFDDIRYFTNCGGDIENLITQIAFANNERSIGKHPKMKNIFTKQDLERGLEMFKYHKAEQADESWKKMFI